MPTLRATTIVALALSLPTIVALGRQEAEAPGPAAVETRGPLARILVTNDDGIDSPALAQLVAALSADADVVVCAPDGNRSGASHSVGGWSEPMAIRAAEVEGASVAVSVGGSPADAVSYGLLTLGADAPFDLVVSGINVGANVGELSHHSGTVGAAMEAVYRGVPAIAVSQGGRGPDFAFAAGFTERFVDQLRERGAAPGLVYSINVPAGSVDDLAGVAVRPMGGSYLMTRGWFERETADGEPGAQARVARTREAPAGSDTEAFNAGHVTITPLRFDWTDSAAVEAVGGWDLALE